MSFKSRETFNRYAAEFSLSSLSLHQYLVAARRQLYKDLYAETMAEIYARAKLQDRNRMIAALRGGSTKKLAAIGGFVSLPRSICAVDGSGKILSEPDAVMEETREYFSKLYGTETMAHDSIRYPSQTACDCGSVPVAETRVCCGISCSPTPRESETLTWPGSVGEVVH
jgi:hypothetical protein